MRLLLDTHAFIWLLTDAKKIPAKTLAAIVDTDNEVCVSAVSFWEIAIKVWRKRLEPIGHSRSTLVEAAESMGLMPIPLLPIEASSHSKLAESTHFDPFDRMLIWQAIHRKLTLVSADRTFARFKRDGLKTLWG